MTTEGTWIGYSGTARIGLAVVLLALAGGLAYAGTRWPGPFQARRPRPAAANLMLAIWFLAIMTFLVCVSVYVHQLRRDFPGRTAPTDPITPVTLLGVGAVFLVILIASRGSPVARFGSAVIGALAAPMIFELPFDLIVMTRTYPIPPDPAWYRVLFFLPLFAIELTTLALLTLSPMVRLSRATFLSFAAMLTVFAVWALSGFGYPSAPLPITLNVVSKILAFVTVLTLFLPVRDGASEPGPGVRGPSALRGSGTRD
jgi:hypothetical protein